MWIGGVPACPRCGRRPRKAIPQNTKAFARGRRWYGYSAPCGAEVEYERRQSLMRVSAEERELILDLSKQYGKHRAFPENGLIDTIVARTSPDTRDFFDRYIFAAQRLPLKEYYAKLGFTLIEDAKGMPQRFEVDSAATPEQLKLRKAWMGLAPTGV